MDHWVTSTAFVGYVLAYGVAGLVCSVAVLRARKLEDPETRRGLVALLAGSGGWAFWELGFLVAPTPRLRYGAYLVSLIVGLATVGAWLYFCSAYTGRSFHRNGAYRRAAVGVYLAIVVVKLTNPLHGLYFTTEFVPVPFPHLTIQHGLLHWLVTGLSYVLVGVGFFMLYELFLEADYDTTPLGVVAALTGLPVVLDVLGFATPWLIDINYEPLGVAVFAVGVLYLFADRFLAVQLTDGVDDAVVYLDDADRIRAVSGRAERLFGSLSGSVGEPFAAVLPAAAARLDGDGAAPDEGTGRILERDQGGERRYYLVSDSSFAIGQVDFGRIVVFTDVTETERRRRELARQNEQLEGFAAAIRHELLNTLQIVDGWVTTAGEALDSGNPQAARESLRTASRTADRMSEIVVDLATLARQGQTLDGTGRVDVEAVATTAWETVETGDATLSVDAGAVEADETRLRNLFESAFVFAVHNGASTVRIRLADDGFVVEGDGDPVGAADPEDFFAYGVSVPDSKAGMALPNLRTFARTHGWETRIDTDYDDGVRVVVSGVVGPDPVPRADD
jgi:signal transduction histidine kinase